MADIADTSTPSDHDGRFCPGCIEATVIEFFDMESDLGHISQNQDRMLARLFVGAAWDALTFAAPGNIDAPELINILQTCCLSATEDIVGTYQARIDLIDDIDARELWALRPSLVLLFEAFDSIHLDVAAGNVGCTCSDHD